MSEWTSVSLNWCGDPQRHVVLAVLKMMMPRHFVYLGVHVNLPAVKVGKAMSVQDRWRQIGIQSFDIEKSIALSFGSETEADMCERVIHRLFQQDKVSDPSLPNDGRTEWFRIEILDELLAFVASQKVRLGLIEVEAARTLMVASERAVEALMKKPRHRESNEQRRVKRMKHDLCEWSSYYSTIKGNAALLFGGQGCRAKLEGDNFVIERLCDSPKWTDLPLTYQISGTRFGLSAQMFKKIVYDEQSSVERFILSSSLAHDLKLIANSRERLADVGQDYFKDDIYQDVWCGMVMARALWLKAIHQHGAVIWGDIDLSALSFIPVPPDNYSELQMCCKQID